MGSKLQSDIASLFSRKKALLFISETGQADKEKIPRKTLEEIKGGGKKGLPLIEEIAALKVVPEGELEGTNSCCRIDLAIGGKPAERLIGINISAVVSIEIELLGF